MGMRLVTGTQDYLKLVDKNMGMMLVYNSIYCKDLHKKNPTKNNKIMLRKLLNQKI
jgi:hypothetical protein